MKFLLPKALACCCLFATTVCGFAQVWAPANASSQDWSAIASSADGNKLVAVALSAGGGGAIYTNSGNVWAQCSTPNTNWQALTSSADGVKLAAGVNGGGIYLSTNSGSTWQPSTAPSKAWTALASSADGSRLVAVAGLPDDVIYTSSDSGNTWVSNNVPNTNWWFAVASSADGRKLAIVGGVAGGSENPRWVYASANSNQLGADQSACSRMDMHCFLCRWNTADCRRLQRSGFDLHLH